MKGRGRFRFLLAGAGLVMLAFSTGCGGPATGPTPSPVAEETTMRLPEPRYDSDISLEESLARRRSVRDYTDEPLTLQELSQLLWAAQGITDPVGFRTAPSAGGLYPLEVYAVVGNVAGLDPGVYHYVPDGHQVIKTIDGDIRDALCDAALGQEWVREAAVVFVFAAVYERTTGKYGDRGIRYVHMEVGHAAENLCLEATALGLGPVTVGAFHDDQVGDALNLPEAEAPLYVIPVGRKTS
jgi:SagB-type dehydrogenase family enzyme